MKNILFTLLYVCMFVSSCDKDEPSGSQAREFVKFFTNFPEFSAADVAVTENGYAVLGTAKTSEDESWICLLRTDAFGNTIDTARLYGITDGVTSNTAYCLKALDNGGFGILGSVINPATGKKSAYFIKTDSEGNSVWTKTFSRQYGDLEAVYFDVSTDESFYMTGYYDSVGMGKQIWWMGVNKDGEDIRNQRLFGFAADDEGKHLTILSDGKLVITGYITQNNTKQAIVIKTTQNTVLQSQFPLSSSSQANESGNCLLPLSDDEFLLLSTLGSTTASQMSLNRLLMSNTQQDTIWTRKYSTDVSEEGRLLLSDSQLVYMLGTVSRGSGTTIALTTTDLSGNQIGRAEFGTGSRLSASAFSRCDDGGFIIAGTNIHPEVNITSVALIKIR
jgi:hypothetical protein